MADEFFSKNSAAGKNRRHELAQAYKTQRVKQRLEYLRGELRAEHISLDELVELQSLATHIEPGDVELLEAAGVPEFPE